jgi:hypothetical protein
MVKFNGGPADGMTLMLKRAPLWLRVVTDRAGSPAGGVDALDQLEDVPNDGEEVFVYERRGGASSVHLRGRTRSISGWYVEAEYDHVPITPREQTEFRDTDAWHRWTKAISAERAQD